MPLDLPVEGSGDGDGDAQGARQGPLSQTIEAHTRTCEIDPVKSRPREKLPEGSYRNYAGFLIRESARVIEVDEGAVEEETTKL
jgi:hypothetical protein